jgi:hypothetical protein
MLDVVKDSLTAYCSSASLDLCSGTSGCEQAVKQGPVGSEAFSGQLIRSEVSHDRKRAACVETWGWSGGDIQVSHAACCNVRY